MLGYLEGKVVFKGEKNIVVEVSGVGYKVFVNAETLRKIGSPSFAKASEGKAKLWTHLYLREDALELYGFLTSPELELFETLIEVPGVGPKTALGILNVAPIETLKNAIASGEISYLTKVSGIGRKTAEKIMVELREKFGKALKLGPELREEEDAVEALESLGYSSRQARETLRQVPDNIKGTSKRVKEALKILGGNHAR
jgi:Holliday junction DNA helicase RuvA